MENASLMDRMIRAAAPSVRHRLWIISDLQQQYPERATRCMTRAVDDFLSLEMPVEAVFYLGDATEGSDPEFIRQMTEMQIGQLARVDAPVYYCPGNHDFDYFRAHEQEADALRVPFVSRVRREARWHVPGSPERMHGIIDMGDYAVCLLPDHGDLRGRWYTTHGVVHGDAQAYPYTAADGQAVTREIAGLGKPVLTMSHYAFPGGNRESALLGRLLPLPDNVLMHFYGHAHIGDAVWAGKNAYRKIAAVDGQAVKQINVASLENYRGTAIRSVIAELYEGDDMGILFRNHTLSCWDDVLAVRRGDCLRQDP